MNSRTRFSGLLLLSTLLMPLAAQATLVRRDGPADSGVAGLQLARGGGGGGPRGGGGGLSRPSGGGNRGMQRPAGQTGFQGASGGLNRGDRTPTGGWSQRVPSSAPRPDIHRGSGDGSRAINRDGVNGPNRDGSGPRDLNRNVNRDVNRDINRNINRDWNRRVNINNININPGWARAGWGYARPWNYGWYGGWSNPPWGWWGAQAAVWGIGALATASVINNAVDAAINSQVSYIVVPDTSYQLLYGSVTPSGSQSVSFAVTSSGSTYQLTADCQAGTLDGRTPNSAAEAQLLNAACQVAFGNT